jgi:hypothetical protein
VEVAKNPAPRFVAPAQLRMLQMVRILRILRILRMLLVLRGEG